MAHDRRKLLVAAALSTGLMAAASAPAFAGGDACRHAQQARQQPAQQSTAGRVLRTLGARIAGGNVVTTAALASAEAPLVALVTAIQRSSKVGNGKKPMYDDGASANDLQAVVAAATDLLP